MNAAELSFLAEPDHVADWRRVLLVDLAIETGVLDALPGRAADVASGLSLDERAVRILLEALAAWEVVTADGDGDGAFAVGPGAPGAEARNVLFHHARALRQWTGGLEDRLRGTPPVEPRPAMRHADRWLAAMAVQARETAPSVVDLCLAAAPDAGTVIDMGGGHGEYALEFARRGLKVTLQDRPAIAEIVRAEGRVEAGGVEVFSGDFFEVLPPARYDVVFCSGVTHTFGGDRVQELFRRAARLLAPGGLLAVQTFLRGRRPVGAIFAVQMLATAGGGDTHAEHEYREWLAGTGFAGPEVIDLDGGRRTLLLAAPAA